MIVCDDFVFLHLHKSGGTFIGQMMLRHMNSAQMIGYHYPYSQLPDDYRHLPVLGSVRNPWAYYVSWYHFQYHQTHPNPLFLFCSQNKKLGFKETIFNLVTLCDNPKLVAALISVFPQDFVGRGLNLTQSCIASIKGSGLGFYSFLYHRLYQGTQNPWLSRTEFLRSDTKAFLSRVLTQANSEIDAFLLEAPLLNTSPHGPYQGYFDEDLRDVIAHYDRSVIKNHGYGF